jgi:hypothetical protein
MEIQRTVCGWVGPPQRSTQCITGAPVPGLEWSGHETTAHLYLLSKLSTHRAIPSSYVFTAWRFIHDRENFTLQTATVIRLEQPYSSIMRTIDLRQLYRPRKRNYLEFKRTCRKISSTGTAQNFGRHIFTCSYAYVRSWPIYVRCSRFVIYEHQMRKFTFWPPCPRYFLFLNSSCSSCPYITKTNYTVCVFVMQY